MAKVIATARGFFGGRVREVGESFVVPDDLWHDKQRRPKWAKLDPSHAFGGRGDHDGDGSVGGSKPAETAHAALVIPEDWRTKHGRTRMGMAHAIIGSPVANAAEADKVIAAYVDSQKPSAPAGNGIQEALGGTRPKSAVPAADD